MMILVGGTLAGVVLGFALGVFAVERHRAGKKKQVDLWANSDRGPIVYDAAEPRLVSSYTEILFKDYQP